MLRGSFSALSLRGIDALECIDPCEEDSLFSIELFFGASADDFRDVCVELSATLETAPFAPLLAPQRSLYLQTSASYFSRCTVLTHAPRFQSHFATGTLDAASKCTIATKRICLFWTFIELTIRRYIFVTCPFSRFDVSKAGFTSIPDLQERFPIGIWICIERRNSSNNQRPNTTLC
jgi:hypothetical protein